MNSFNELNAVGATVLEVSDSRPATVIFDRDLVYDRDLDQPVTYTSNVITFTPSINIEEIINYSTANARFRVEIVTSGADPGSIDFGTLPTGLTLTQAGSVYTITGIKDSVQWSTISTFTWTMPADYASQRLFYLKLSILYYDAVTNTQKDIDWYYYDETFYYNFYQNVIFNQNVDYRRIRTSSASMTSNFVLSAVLPNFARFKFVMTSQGEPTSFCQLNAVTNQQITAKKLVNIASSLTSNMSINYNSSLANILVNTISPTSTYTRMSHAIFTPDLSKIVLLAYNGLENNGSAGNWGILYYNFNRITNSITFNQFIAIESATFQTFEPNPLVGAYQMETSDTGEFTGLFALKRDGTSAANYTYSQKIYTVIKSTQTVLGTTNIRYSSISPNAQRSAHVNSTNSFRNITIRSQTADLYTTPSEGYYLHYPKIRYNSTTGVYWLACIGSQTNPINSPEPGLVRLFNSSDNYQTSLELDGVSSLGTNSPNNLAFDSTGTNLVVLTGYTGYSPSNPLITSTAPEIYIFRYNGTNWVQYQYWKIYETWANAPFHRTRFSTIYVSNNARQILISLEGSSTNIYSLLYEWNGTGYTLKVTNANEYASPPESIYDFSGLSSIDRYYILEDSAANPDTQRIYRYQG